MTFTVTGDMQVVSELFYDSHYEVRETSSRSYHQKVKDQVNKIETV